MEKNAIIVLLSISTVALTILYARKETPTPQTRVPVPEKTVASAPKEHPLTDVSELADLKSELAKKSSEIQSLRDKLAAALTPTAVVPSNPASVSSTNAPIEKTPVDLQSAIEKLVSDGLIPARRGQSKAPTTREKYSQLIRNLGLSDAQSNRFINLLKNSHSLSPAIQQRSQEDIRELLGDDAYAEYKEYERIMPTRLFVDDLALYLSDTGHPLNENQVDSMLKLDPDIAGGIPLSYMPTTITLKNHSGDNTAQMVDGAVDESVEKFDKTTKYAEGILTDEQMKGMDNYLGDRFGEKEAAASAATTILPKVVNKDLLRALGSGSSNVNMSISIMPSMESGGIDASSGTAGNSTSR